MWAKHRANLCFVALASVLTIAGASLPVHALPAVPLAAAVIGYHWPEGALFLRAARMTGCLIALWLPVSVIALALIFGEPGLAGFCEALVLLAKLVPEMMVEAEYVVLAIVWLCFLYAATLAGLAAGRWFFWRYGANNG